MTTRSTSSSNKNFKSSAEEISFDRSALLFVSDQLFYDFDPAESEYCIGGSIQTDDVRLTRYTGKNEDSKDSSESNSELVVWGASIAVPDSALEALHRRIKILALAGPASASKINLDRAIPLGEPNLLIPAFYTPSLKRTPRNKTVCVPHPSDARSDRFFIEATRCDIVLRPVVKNYPKGLFDFLDVICSSSMVLCGSKGVAAVAAAFGIPFAFFSDASQLDPGIEWHDFSQLAGIDCTFVSSVEDARKTYDQQISKNISLPTCWDLIVNSPHLLRETGLVAVLRHELRNLKPSSLAEEVERRLALLQANRPLFSHIEKKIKKEVSAARDSKNAHDKLAWQYQKNSSISEPEHGDIRRRLEITEAKSEKASKLAELYREHNDEVQRSTDAKLAEIAAKMTAIEKKWTSLSETERLPWDRKLQTLKFFDREQGEYIRSMPARPSSTSFSRGDEGETSRRSDDPEQERDDRENADRSRSSLARPSLKFDKFAEPVTDLWARRQNDVTKQDELAQLNGPIAVASEKLFASAQEMSRQIAELEEHVRQETANREALSLELRDQKEINEGLSAQNTRLQQRVNGLQSQLSTYSDDAMVYRDDLIRLQQAESILVNFEEHEIRKSASFRSRVFSALNLITTNPHSKLNDVANEIESYVSEFDPATTGTSAVGRRSRILKYVMGLTDFLEDFPLIRNADYRELNPDVGGSVNPLFHFIRRGRQEGRAFHPLFDSEFYSEQYPEVRFLAFPVEHYLKWGASKFYDPHPLFDTKAYFGRYPDVSARGLNPLVHFLAHKRCTAHPLFDPNFYLLSYPDVADSIANPIAHYLLKGWRAGLDPSPEFNTTAYLQQNTDVAAAGINPLVHYVRFGVGEGRAISRSSVDPEAYGETDHHGSNVLQPGGARESATGKWVRVIKRKPIVVMMDAFFPRPDQDSGSVDQVNFIRIFQALGFKVHYVGVMEFNNAVLPELEKYVNILEEMGVQCIRADGYDYIEDYMFLNSEKIKLFFNSRVNFGGAYISAARKICPEAKIIFNTVDLHYIRERREAEVRGNGDLAKKAGETQLIELAAARSADAVIVVSTTEYETLKSQEAGLNCAVVPLIRDFERSEVPGLANRTNIAFVGSFQHRPNIDAVIHFLDEIWPQIVSRQPEIRFAVVGSSMPDSFRDRRDVNVDFVGFVEDLEEFLLSIRLTVAPLRFGAGAKGKVISSMGCGAPCVVSQIASEGMGFEDGEDIIVAELGPAFADAVLKLYNDRELWSHVSSAGLAAVKKQHSMERGISLITQVLSSIGIESSVQ
jgi:glycosyltransferase involved in cell wall biosynthesis